jgi:TatD DNase family protein
MDHCSVNNICISSISSHCDQRCGCQIHIPPQLPIYDGHIHLNQIISKIESDFVSAKAFPSIREYHFINNNHKPNEWLVPNPSPFSSHVHIYPTIGIHPKYFNSQSIYQNLNDLNNYLEISRTCSIIKNKIVAIGEFGLDETATATIDHQLFVLQKQIDLANQFHLPIVLHCRGFHLFQTLFDCLKNREFNRHIPIHWHCINSNSNLDVIDLFLNQFPNSYIGLNGSITYESNNQNSILFNNWLKDRSPFISKRLILETDYPYLSPRNLYGVYDPSCAIISTALYLEKMIENPYENVMSLLLSSNLNIKSMYNL